MQRANDQDIDNVITQARREGYPLHRLALDLRDENAALRLEVAELRGSVMKSVGDLWINTDALRKQVEALSNHSKSSNSSTATCAECGGTKFQVNAKTNNQCESGWTSPSFVYRRTREEYENGKPGFSAMDTRDCPACCPPPAAKGEGEAHISGLTRPQLRKAGLDLKKPEYAKGEGVESAENFAMQLIGLLADIPNGVLPYLRDRVASRDAAIRRAAQDELRRAIVENVLQLIAQPAPIQASDIAAIIRTTEAAP